MGEVAVTGRLRVPVNCCKPDAYIVYHSILQIQNWHIKTGRFYSFLELLKIFFVRKPVGRIICTGKKKGIGGQQQVRDNYRNDNELPGQVPVKNG